MRAFLRTSPSSEVSLISIFSLIVLAPLLSLRAQDAPDSIRLQTVVIQATRAGANHPVPHTNINAATLQKRNQGQDVPFLLSSVPSLVETSDAGAGIGYTALRIRGSDQTRINVTINGAPLNDAESQQVFWVNLPNLAASASEIQVQRGVGTSTNGAGAFGGTINLDLSQVHPEPFAQIHAAAGSFNTHKQSVQLGTGLIDGRAAFSARWSRIGSDGYIDRASADLNALHLSGAWIGERQSLQAHFLSGHEITYQAWYGVPAQFINDPERRRYNPAGTERPGGPYSDEVDDYTQRHLLLHYRNVLRPDLQLQVNGHYTRGFGFFEQYKAAQSFEDYGLPPVALGDTLIAETDLVRRRQLDNHFYGGTFALRWTPAVNPPILRSGPELTLGGALNQYAGRHFGSVIWSAVSAAPKDSRYYDNDALKTDGNLYGQVHLHWRNGISYFVDVQYRRVHYTFLGIDNLLRPVDQNVSFNFWNPKVGLNWALRHQWNAHLFYGIGNREPNRDDFTQSTPASRPRPERLHDVEAGLRYAAANWSLSANLFFMYYRDQLVLDGRINDVGAYIRTNVPESYRSGLELEGAFKTGKRWSGNAFLTLSRNIIPEFTAYLDDWDLGGQQGITHRQTDIAFSPAVIGRAEATFHALPHRKQQLDLTLIGKYVGKQYLDNTSSPSAALDPYFFSDVRLNWEIPTKAHRISFIFTVQNLFDARFISNGWMYRYISKGYDARPDNPYTRLEGEGVYNQTGYFPQAGRNWLASVVIGLGKGG
jgi:iron complex outermembrane receptor protein